MVIYSTETFKAAAASWTFNFLLILLTQSKPFDHVLVVATMLTVRACIH